MGTTPEANHGFGNAAVWTALTLAAFTFPTLVGCDATTSAPDNQVAATSRMDDHLREQSKVLRLDSVQSVGNGVYVFETNAEFPETLSDFIEKKRETNPDFSVISVTQGGDVKYGLGTTSYARSNSFVVVANE